jgi:hypothetical protein
MSPAGPRDTILPHNAIFRASFRIEIEAIRADTLCYHDCHYEH